MNLGKFPDIHLLLKPAKVKIISGTVINLTLFTFQITINKFSCCFVRTKS
jgi:hypothetical protein